MQFDEFLSIVDLLKTPEKYEAKITELKNRKAEIDAAISQLGLGSDIEAARKAAVKQKEQAEKYVQAAKDMAEKITADAAAVYTKKFDELQKQQVKADQALAENKTMKEQFASRENGIRQREKELEDRAKQLDADRADLAAKQADVEARLLKLRDVMGA